MRWAVGSRQESKSEFKVKVPTLAANYAASVGHPQVPIPEIY